MEKLNDKIKSSDQENHNLAQVVGLYGHNNTDGRWKKIHSTDDNSLKVDVEGSIGTDTSGTPLKLVPLLRVQKDVIDNKLGTVVAFLDKDTPNSVGNTIVQDKLVTNIVGSDDGTNTGNKHNVRVDGNGRLSVDINSGIPTKTDGSAGHSTPTGIGLIGFDSGTANAVYVDSNGVLKVQNVASVNVLPANSLNSGITDDPADSIAVGLRGRTDPADKNTETFLKCNASGELLTSGGGGGGSSSSTQTSNTIAVPDSTMTTFGDGGGNNYVDTNGGNKFVIVVNGASSGGSPSVNVEWSNDNTFPSGHIFVSNGYISGNNVAIPLTSFDFSSRLDTSTLGSQMVVTYDHIPARFCRITMFHANGSPQTFNVKTYLSP